MKESRPELRKCQACGAYTMKREHCGKQTFSPEPARYSPADRYGEYRRKALYTKK